MYGRIFASMFAGSMVGIGPDAISVWAYVLAHMQRGYIELNPVLLGVIIGMPSEDAEAAIAKLCEADGRSRNKAEDGRRLVREGEYTYRVVSWPVYEDIKRRDELQQYNTKWKRDKRATAKDPTPINGHAIIPDAEPQPAPDVLSDPRRRWPYERQEWGQQYVSAGCKIGPENWPTWKALAEKHGGHARVVSAASSVPATNRWPDQTESILIKSMGQEPSLADAVSHKKIKIRND